MHEERLHGLLKHPNNGANYTVSRKNTQVQCYKTAYKLLQICSQAVDKLCSHCLFPVVVTSLEQAVNNL
jgi:hypothetical protein